MVRAPGRVNLLEVSALGYRTHVDTVYLPSPEDSLTLEVRLGVDAIPLDPLVVVAPRRPVWESTQPKYLWEFFEREQIYSRLGTGLFFDREALDVRFGTMGSLTQLPTLWPAASYLREERPFNRCRGEVFFVDGIEFQGDMLREIPWGIRDLAAVEVYTDYLAMPVELTTGVLRPCRVMVIWTQRPVVPEGIEEEGREAGWFLPVLAFLGIVLAFAIR